MSVIKSLTNIFRKSPKKLNRSRKVINLFFKLGPYFIISILSFTIMFIFALQYNHKLNGINRKLEGVINLVKQGRKPNPTSGGLGGMHES